MSEAALNLLREFRDLPTARRKELAGELSDSDVSTHLAPARSALEEAVRAAAAAQREVSVARARLASEESRINTTRKMGSRYRLACITALYAAHRRSNSTWWSARAHRRAGNAPSRVHGDPRGAPNAAARCARRGLTLATTTQSSPAPRAGARLSPAATWPTSSPSPARWALSRQTGWRSRGLRSAGSRRSSRCTTRCARLPAREMCARFVRTCCTALTPLAATLALVLAVGRWRAGR